MSIWGKIVGGAAGFAMGGPIGALLGSLAGHAVDFMAGDLKRVEPPPEGAAPDGAPFGQERPEATRQIAFTIGVIVLGAKMAKADGRVTPDEIRAFREVFQVPPGEVKNVGRIFDLARRDARGYEPYARQLGKLFQHHLTVLEELLDGLFHIARADGKVAEVELAYLEGVARNFGFDQATWKRIRAANLGEASDDPYTILGVEPGADLEHIKTAHRALVREHHPDRLMAQGLPPEFIAVATEKLAKINAAWDEVRKRQAE